MKIPALVLALSLTTGQALAVTIHTTDFIDDGSRTLFLGFESAGHNPGSVYSEGGINVEQVNGDSPMWTTYFHPENQFGWYPNGGDHGYTRITTADGAAFGDFGLLRGSGWGFTTLWLAYELLNDGGVVASGVVSHTNVPSGTYLGFSGAAFDEVRLRDGTSNTLSLYDGGLNGLAIDAIEARAAGSTVPDAGSTALLAGLGLLTLVRFRTRQ